MRTPTKCPVCKGKFVKLSSNSNSLICDKSNSAFIKDNSMPHKILLSFISINGITNILNFISLEVSINDKFYDVIFYHKLAKKYHDTIEGIDIFEEIDISSPINKIIPYFKPDFSDLNKLIAKIDKYLTFS